MKFYFRKCKSNDEARKIFHKLCIQFLSNKNEKKDLASFYDLQKQYRSFLTNNGNNLYAQSYTEVDYKDVNSTLCQCGTYYDIENIEDDMIACETCSLFINVNE